jgi:hypothetical protein
MIHFSIIIPDDMKNKITSIDIDPIIKKEHDDIKDFLFSEECTYTDEHRLDFAK